MSAQLEPTIAYVTAGGAGMFCGSCMRDNALAAELHARGVPITLIPTFTPIRVDEPDHSDRHVFLGGINVYLEQKLPWLGRIPKPFRRALDHPVLLRALSKLALQTRSEDDAQLALSLLKGTDGHQAAEIRDLVDFVDGHVEPDVVALTNLLIAGFLPELRRRGAARGCQPLVSVALQGDDIFLDTLRPADRERVVVAMRGLVPLVDVFLTFTEDYKRRMAALFEIPEDRIHVIPLGLARPEDFAPPDAAVAGDRPPTLGYLARICPEKGFGVLVDAFLRLRAMPGTEHARLRCGGWLGPSDRAFFEQEKAKIEAAGAAEAFDHVDLPDRASKIALLHSVDVFSVPATYRECKGLYVLEALAAGVPVVQPSHGSFPELLASTGGGELVTPNDPEALAHALHVLLIDRPRRVELGRDGRQGVLAKHTVARMAHATLTAWTSSTRAGR